MIENKNSRRNFNICYSIITVDASDGSGKSTFSKVLKECLSETYPEKDILLVKSTNFDLSPGAVKCGESLARRNSLKENSVRHNLYYLCAMAENYKQVISEAVNNGKIIISDSSEIRALAYILDKGDNDAISSTYKSIDTGFLTRGILSGNRIILSVSPEDCLFNLQARGKKDCGDPTNLSEVKRRQQCYDTSIDFIKNLAPSDVNWMFVENRSYMGSSPLTHLRHRIHEEIIPRLKKIDLSH